MQIRRADSGSPTSGGIPWGSLLAAVFPNWWGRPSEALLDGGPASYNERAFYAGAVALLFTALALVSRGAWRRKAPFLLLLALGLTVPMDPSPVRSLVVQLPGFDRVQNARTVLWFAFAVAVLAAFGLQAALEAPRRQARAWAAVGVAIVAGVAAIVSIDLAPGDVAAAFDHVADRFAGPMPSPLALASVIRWLAFAALVGLGLLALHFGSRRPAVAGATLALLGAANMLLFAHAYQPMGPKALVMPPRTPAVAFLQRHVADGRIAGVGLALSSDWSTTYGLRDVRGYDAPQPSRRFYALWTVINPTQQPGAPFDVADLSPEGLRVLSLLGTRYVVIAPEAGPPPGNGLTYAYRGADAAVLENPRAAPRALVADRVHVAAGEQAELATVLRRQFDPRRDAVVRRDELGSDRLAGASGGSVRVVEEANARVVLRASLPRRGLVVLGDAWAPGWSVTIDGRPARELQANVVLRGVVVPAGRHTIEWRYRVPGLRAGAAISGVGLLGLLAWAGVLLRGRRARLFTR